MSTLERPGDYIEGAFRPSKAADGEVVVASPADQSDIVSRFDITLAHAEDAVGAARAAAPAWARTPIDERRRLLQAYAERCEAHRQAITDAIMREVGKPRWDASTEAGALAAKVKLMLGEGATYTADRELDDLPGAIRHRPLGVVAVIGPFNFPAHLPNGQIVPALLHGNTVVFKPSEKTPSAAYWMARCFDEAGFPPGVVNVIIGAADSARALVASNDIDAVLFTGSSAVGKAIIAANAHRPGRLIALELGGKNASIVLDDAPLERAVNQIGFAAFATSGQRCTATSRVYVHRSKIEVLAAGLSERAKAIAVGHPMDEVFMGPMISEASRGALWSALEKAKAHGFEALVEADEPDVRTRGWYVRPSVYRASSADARVPGYTHDELFGPNVALYAVDSLDEAIERANDTAYGLAGAVFTRTKERFEEAASRLRVGVCHWNQSTAGASGRLPFGGVGDSGNHRPAGIYAGRFCAFPQAVRYAPAQDAPLPSWPGW
ncbi:MAG: aldehyde dehydrogenase family protein [Myxococcota bacterium]